MIRYLACASAVLLAAVAAAQVPPPVTDAIVVEGQREQQAEQAANLARAITPSTPHGKPLARHYVPICVKVFGVPDRFAAAMTERIASNIRSLKLRVAPAGCQPNAWVGLLKNSRAQVQALRKREPAMFISLKKHEIDRIFADGAAVQAWHATEVRGLDGRPIDIMQVEVRPGVKIEVERNQQFKASRLGSTIRVDLTGSIVLFDRQLARDKTLQQLADYATMRLLANTRDGAATETGVATILSLFAPNGAAPAEWTEFDRAYLRGVYRMRPDQDHRGVHDAAKSAFLRGLGAEPEN